MHLPVNLTENRKQLLILGYTHTQEAIRPGIVTAQTHGEGRTQATNAMGPFLRPDEPVSHLDSLAKNAAAYFKMSRSSVILANSRVSRASSAADSACRPEPGNAPPCLSAGVAELTGNLGRRPLARIQQQHGLSLKRGGELSTLAHLAPPPGQSCPILRCP